MAAATQRKLQPENAAAPITEPLAPTPIVLPTNESPSPSISPPPLSAEEIYRLIQEAAYFKAEARQFAPGVELKDWLEAEEEVRRRLRLS
jgi:hypothetical protein